MTKEQAARENCLRLNEARRQKERQLEEEIRKSSASSSERANMLHTLSKLTMFSADERDQLTHLGTAFTRYGEWIDSKPVTSLRITVNGEGHTLLTSVLTYDDIVQMAGVPSYKGRRDLTVIYHVKLDDNSSRSGVLLPDATVQVLEGMHINVADTSNA